MTTTSSQSLPETEALVLSLDEYIRARYSLIAVQTYEEERFLRFMRALAQHERHRAKGLYVWSRPRGLRMVAGPGIGAEPRTIPNREDPLSVIEYVEQEVEAGLFVLCDFAPYLLDYGAPKPELVRQKSARPGAVVYGDELDRRSPTGDAHWRTGVARQAAHQ